jgi:hypothetical protein
MAKRSREVSCELTQIGEMLEATSEAVAEYGGERKYEPEA